MSNWAYLLSNCGFGLVLGATTFGWLRWLLWELHYGRGSDHSYNYVWGLFILGGAIAGALVGGMFVLFIISRSGKG